MKKSKFSILCIILASCIILSCFNSCSKVDGTVIESEDTVSNSVISEKIETSEKESATENTENDDDSKAVDETQTESATSDIVELSNVLKNGVNVYYSNSAKNAVSIENKVINMEYSIDRNRGNMLVSHLSTKQGIPYIHDTMDIILKMKDGSAYKASASSNSATLNIYRMGFYYYETRLEGQNFSSAITTDKELSVGVGNYSTANDVKRAEVTDGVLSYRTGGGGDPYLIYPVDYSANEYDYLELTLRTANDCKAEIWMVSGDETAFTQKQRYGFDIYGGEEYFTYYLPVSEKMEGYSGKVSQIRFDINAAVNETVEIAGIKAIKATLDGAPKSVTMQRSFLTYSTKLHHLVQICTTEEVGNVLSVDMVTDIDYETVSAFVIKDKNGLRYDTLEGIDWASCEYVGFDIKNAGIFGYILPFNGENGILSVALEGGRYTVTQSCPVDSFVPSKLSTANADDFYMGQRIYTDENHTFAEFIKEAESERHPLTDENITVDEEYDEAKFVGYDPLYGFYRFSVSGTGFNQAYYVHPNKQFRVNFTVVGDEYDRMMYFMTNCSKNGNLESSVLLGDGDLLLPVPMEVCKNFGTDGENTIYNLDDIDYSETYFPIMVKAGEEKTYTSVNFYQNWGIFPLKQISSIQFHLPYYHLSTGVTESNCIVPFASSSGPALPDHRAMSAPLWPTQPQHTSGGGHSFIRSIDRKGYTVYSNFIGAKIDSYGPTYADIEMKYLTWDGRIEATYIHTEMPQTDENRTYYEMSYLFKEDVKYTDFAHQFAFYTVTDNNDTGLYQKLGYLAANNKSQVTAAKHAGESEDYVLGNNCPYFTLFDMAGYAPDSETGYGYVNVAFLVYNYKVIINGEEADANFLITNKDDLVHLSLNLGEITFKAGDTISINAIILPWGSEQSDYSGSEPDANVRRVRENTLLDPVVITPTNNCEVIESVFTPKIRTTNGYSAEFAISGGENNITVRVYGFDKLTAPTIKQYVNGRWITYKTFSAAEKDDCGYGYMYDGYMVHYDPDGTYSYSFVIDMTGNETKQFRIDAYEDFKKWPKVEYETNDGINSIDDPINVYVDANELNFLSNDLIGLISSHTVLNDGDFDYIRYFASEAAAEAYIKLFDATNSAYKNLQSTGQYMVLKYRLPADAPAILKDFQIFTNTTVNKPQGNDKYNFKNPVHDGNWHVIVINLAAVLPDYFKTNDQGQYKAQFLRLDFFNQSSLPEDMYIDIAYVGICDSLEKICEINLDMKQLIFVEARDSIRSIEPSDYEATQPDPAPELTETPLNVYIAPAKIKLEGDKVAAQFSSVVLSDDGEYVRFNANSERRESILPIFKRSDEEYSDIGITGQYAIIKYRLPEKPVTTLNNIQYWSSTITPTPQGNDKHEYYSLVHDGNWHVIIIDLAATLPDSCVADSEGQYSLQFFRIDVFNSPENIPNEMYMDIAYVGFCDDLNKAYEFNADMEYVSFINVR